ncbi:hypothetical protein FA13DRAFT_1682764 [Coprinellus micaceus]|uniref:Uncharacterized protein n=1 Tax=Coprinellus micaceus TaxID=71717 RepID=A0A4Y7TRH7_COPMI|nr:hypothetical protein FA13DRAFT_1682764 [Coprinellus micaceus]
MANYGARTSTSPLAQHSFEDLDLDDADTPQASTSKPRKPIDPQLALELRVRWLEALVSGLSLASNNSSVGRSKGKGKANGLGVGSENLVRLAENVQRELEAAVEGNEGLKKFMDHYDQHAHFLTPAFALSGVLPDEESYSALTPEEVNAFLTEMEPDIRAADSDLREMNELVKKGVTSSGKLGDYESLQPRLDALLSKNKADIELADALERRIATLVQKHATSVDTLSELFVAWDDAVTGAEDAIMQMEKEKKERSRLGLE